MTALKAVSLSVRENEFFTLLGPSGCGKTTLLRLIAGFEQPTTGAIWIGGEDVVGLPPFKRSVNTVFQSYALFPHLSVAQNIGFGLRMRGFERAAIDKTVGEMLELVQLSGAGDRRPNQLSGGQQQRVALARALANRPEVLLLDEPLSALDFKLRKEMQLELKRLQRETGVTFVFVTHDQEEALTMSDRLAVMSNGEVQQIGGPTEVYEFPANRFVADFIGETNILEGSVEAVQDGEILCRLGNDVQVAVRGRADIGARVSLAVRPERLSLEPAAELPGAGRLDGTVAEAIYLGNGTSYHVDIADGGRLLVRGQNRADGRMTFARGERVSVHIAPESIRLLRE
ncbi:ABC transporter ATP-binding protein [Virgifigura deserti]|uniref:ABC transporter ATP-binding protein n=1 Tax=Virgifigura deserti TaxID=2268457 RepID=UPI003CCC14AF